MKLKKSLLICFLIYSCAGEPLRCKDCAQRKASLPVEQLRLLRYEYLKNQILKKLHLTEAPKTNLPKPPLKSLLVIAEMAENETILETDDQSKTESVVIYPKNENLSCSSSSLHPCCRFEFSIPESLQLENVFSAEVWFYKNQSAHARVYQIITDELRSLTSSFELENMTAEKTIKSWIKYIILSDNIRTNLSAGNTLVLEVTGCSGEADSNMVIGKTGAEKPFLVIRSDKTEELSRSRRSMNCDEGVTSCCKENFFLNFSEIGWDNWILHPDGYQANFCRGRCFNDLSNTRFYHSAVLLSYIRDNKDIAEEIGLNMCCTPSVMAPVTIIYRNEEGLIYHKSIENMKVEACDCA